MYTYILYTRLLSISKYLLFCGFLAAASSTTTTAAESPSPVGSEVQEDLEEEQPAATKKRKGKADKAQEEPSGVEG